MSERKPLAGTILLCGEGDNGPFQRTFTIVREVGRGASSISCEAFYKGSGRGILKEFYPADGPGRRYALERDANGQLVTEGSLPPARRAFLEAQARYLAPYRTMLEARLSSRGDDVLGTFIPPFELYYGCDRESQIIGSVYIWTPAQELTTFDKVCADIQAHPETEPERKLYRALNAVQTLTDCICALHTMELLHRDIKPSNFGFQVRSGELLTQTMTMFDINSICSVYDPPEEAIGTRGFAAPEVGYERLDNRADIYSIGATLFSAIIVDREHAGGYRPEDYGRLKELVDTSRLIQASEGNSHPRLRNMLTTILQKCLAPEREDRYAACEELRTDLERAIRYLLPARFSGELLPGERLVLVSDVERSLDRNREKNSRLAFQHLLYRWPLYRWSPPECGELNVLVAGFGSYGQKFLDECLQAGQMWGKELRVTVISGDATDQTLYLQERPALAEFFQINEPIPKDIPEEDRPYGSIHFETAEFSKGDPEQNRRILEEKLQKSGSVQYVFIALGEDGLNAAAARDCAAAVEALSLSCFISYVQEDSPAEVSGAVPVLVNEDASQGALYQDVERMAFNTHLVWEKALNLEPKAVRARFRRTYNHDSCAANVLSIKYKLYGAGIDLEACGPEAAAKAFSVLSMDRKRRDVMNRLTWLEHRRWVTEKLCRGWRPLGTDEASRLGSAKDERTKRHTCICKSRPEPLLSVWTRKPGGREKWNTAGEEELDTLDALDRMSVELHRAYDRRARALKEEDSFLDTALSALQSMAEGDPETLRAFREWQVCVYDIFNQDAGKVKQYQTLRSTLKSALRKLPDRVRAAADKQLESFDGMFRPILAGMEYQDYKQEDVELVQAIPFILTYHTALSLVIPMAVGDNTEVFGNVASAALANPAKLFYLYRLERADEIGPLKEAVSYVSGYLDRKTLKAEVELIITCPNPDRPPWTEALETALKEAGGPRIKAVKRLQAASREEAPQVLRRYLSARRLTRNGFMEVNDTKLSHLLAGAGFYQGLRRYQFDPVSQKFHGVVGCEPLLYLRRGQSISAADIAAFRGSSTSTPQQPEFFEDYKKLWKTYCQDPLAWKRACSLLAEYAAQHDELAALETNVRFGQVPECRESRYILPLDCRPAADTLIRGLVKLGAIEPESRVQGSFTGACAVLVQDKHSNKAQLDRLFSNPYALMQPDALQVYRKGGKARVIFDSLRVPRLDIRMYRGYSDLFERICGVLQFWSLCGYAANLSIEDGVVSFTYATRSIKQLMTSAGRILEIYVYHKAKETGLFDDVVSSFELDWAQEDVKNEFDCILTKGFCSLFVECKARPVIEQDYYFKLSCLAKRFGINARAVLIADTQEKEWQDSSAVNRVQRKRGSMLDVITIWKPIEIGNIGNTLLKILNGSYEEEPS